MSYLNSRRRRWCCSFAVPPSSPDHIKREPAPKVVGPTHSIPASPQSSSKSSSGLNYAVGRRIDRILSPGRVSPILDPSSSSSFPNPNPDTILPPPRSADVSAFRIAPVMAPPPPDAAVEFDVRISLRGKQGGGGGGGIVVLEMNSGVLMENSRVFSRLIRESRRGGSGSSRSVCRIEVAEVEDLGVFRETIELMFEDDIPRFLVKAGPYRSIAILEVSASIMFQKGIVSCLKYLEAVPWTEEEEEKLRNLFAVFKFDATMTKDIMGRLYVDDSLGSNQNGSNQNLAQQLVMLIISCTDAHARNELKSLVKGILCKSSVYEKDQCDLSKDDIYGVCKSSMSLLVTLFEEASGIKPHSKTTENEMSKPLIERVSREVDNLIWLLEILLDRQMGEEFVGLWADQQELLKMHESASPMVRYEISRVSAMLFIAMGTRKLYCPFEARAGLLQSWFSPMLSDFGWLQRCKKGLDVTVLEESMGQALLTLPLKQQYVLFMEWFRCFSKHGTEYPNLSKAFQIWWRRSFLRGSETHAIESR